MLSNLFTFRPNTRNHEPIPWEDLFSVGGKYFYAYQSGSLAHSGDGDDYCSNIFPKCPLSAHDVISAFSAKLSPCDSDDIVANFGFLNTSPDITKF